MAKFYAKAPDGTDATLSITVEGFTQSLQQNGWCKMPNGLILQWSYQQSYDWNNSGLLFPITFTTVLCILPLIQTTNGNNMSKNRVYSNTYTTSSFTIYNPEGSYTFIAIGY